MTGGCELTLDVRIHGEVRPRQIEALCAQSTECAKRNRVINSPCRNCMLGQNSVDEDVGTVASGPGRGHYLATLIAQSSPQRLGSRVVGRTQGVNRIAADRCPKSAQ